MLLEVVLEVEVMELEVEVVEVEVMEVEGEVHARMLFVWPGPV